MPYSLYETRQQGIMVVPLNCPLERQINKIIKGNFSETLKDLQMFHTGESPEHFNRKIIQVAFSQVPASKRLFLKHVFKRGHFL